MKRSLYLVHWQLRQQCCCLLGGGQFFAVQAADTQINDSKYYTNGSDLHTDISKTIDKNTNQKVTDPHYAIAVGENTVATGTDAIAAGTHNTASGNSSIAFGGTYLQQTVRKHGANCKVYQIVDKTYYLYGKQYFSTEDDKQFTGDTSTATAVMVNGGNTASGVASVAFGQNTQAMNLGSVAFGMGTQAGDGNGGQNSVAFGNYTKALGGRSVAFGENTIANYNDSVAFGNDTRALSTGATAFGNRTRALAKYSTAWGNATVAADEESTAWGTDTIAGAKLDENGAVTNNYKIDPNDKNEPVKQEQMDVHGNLAYIQSNGKTAGIKQMKIDSGSELHDYVVLDGQDGNTYVRDYQGSLWKVNVDANGQVTVDTTAGNKGKVYNGNGTNKTSLAKTTVNNKEVDITPDSVLKRAHEGTNGYDIEGYKDATAFGYSTEASGDYATAFGNDTQAKAEGATAFGKTTTASGDNATAFGLSTTASGKQATAFGSSSTASGDNTTAFGENSTASGEAATAFGINSNASGKNSFAALGGTASAENAAAIGNGAQATLDGSVALGSSSVADRESGAKGYDMLTKAETTNTSATWVANANAIAVGNGSTLTRQITGVAAGSQDTDAVNVAQLKAAGFKVTTQKKGDISSSILNGDTLDFEAKDNAIVSTSKDSKTITVAVSKTPTFDSATFYNPNPTDGQNNEKVTIANGHISTYKKAQQERAVLGTDNQGNGTLHLVNNDLSQVHLYTQKANDGNGVNDGVTRMWYTASSDGEGTGTHTIAVLDDGINYVGDNYTDEKKTDKVVVKHKLNSTMDVTGGADTNNLSDKNIGVVATPAVEDEQGNITQKAKLEIKLNKNLDLTNQGSVKMGDTTINNGGVTINPNGDKTNTISLTENGLNNGGKTITNVGNGTNPTDAVNVSQLNAAKTTVKSSDNSISVTADPNVTSNYAYDIKVATATLSNEANGTVSVTKTNNNANSYATGNSVADAINKAGFTLTTSNSGGGSVSGTSTPLIKPGSTVTLDAGKNIALTQADSKVTIALNKDINLNQNGSLTVGGDKQDGSTTVEDPIIIKHFDAGKLTVTGTDKDGKTPQSKAGDYVTGLDNKDWDVDYPTYVSGRAATEDQLKTISDAVKEATTKAGKHTVVTVNDKDSSETTASVGTDGKYGAYSDSTKGNLLIAAKDDNGQLTYNIKLNDQLAIGKNGTDGQDGKDGKDGKVTVETSKGTTVVIGHDGEPGKDGKDGISVKGKDGKDGVTISVTNGKDGKDGSEGHIGLTGPAGKDGKAASADIHVKNGQNGVDGTDGSNGKDGMDRIVYEDHNGKPHEVATMDDGLKFVGDDSMATPVTKKLNETLQIRGDGTYNKDKNTVADDGNIKTSVDNGTIKVALNDNITLHQDGSLSVGGDTQDGSKTGQDPIVIKHFDDKTLDVITGVDKDGKPIPANKKAAAGDYVTGLDNKDWNVNNPEYVSGRAATEDQLKKISDTIKSNAETAAGQHTEITVNDKTAPTTVDKVGTTDYGDYAGGNDNLLIAAKKDTTSGKMTYNIKLNDQLTIGQKGEQGEPGKPGTPGKDGKVTVETKGGTTVVIGHDGKDGEDGKDGLFVTGKDGKDGKSGVSLIGPNGKDGKDGVDGKVGIAGKDGKDAVSIAGKDGVGHIGLTGPKGEKGADGTPGKDGISIDITTDLKTATLDDGKNVKTVIKDKDGKETTIEQAPRIQYDSNGKSYEVATMDDGLKFVGNDGKEVTKKLNSTLSLTGGMDKDAVAKASSKNLGVRSNKDGDGLEIVMTDTPDFTKVTVGEGTDPNSKITIGKQTVTGKKADGADGTEETGKYITGLDNTKWNKDNVVENRAATEGQLRDIAGSITNQNQGGGFALTSDEKGADKIVKQDLGKAIQVKGDTTYKADGSVEKAGNIKTSIDNGAIKVELNKNVDLTQEGSIKAGETTINKGGVDTNKITIKDSTISISKDGINGGGKQITNVASGATEIIKGADGKDVYKYDNETNAANIGDVKRIAGDMKNEINNNISNVTNKVDQIGQHVDNIQKDVTQLQQDVKADRTYQGDDGAAKKVKVKFGSFLSLTGGAKLADLTEEGNIGVVQKEIDDPDHKGEKIAGLSVRLAKRLNLEKTTYTSNENGQTYTSEIDGKGLTIKTGDENRDITVQDGNVNMGGNQIHNVAPGQAPGDAVNVGQLNATNYAVNKLGTRVNRVGAGAAALAALHPLDFDPDDKWDFAAGYGNYKDASAVAVGAYYRPNEDTMFSVGGSFGGGENMVNAGVSFKVGQGNHVSTSRVAMAKEIKDLRQDVANLNAIVNRQSALIDKLTGTNAGTIQDTGNDLFPDVPANHWAYEYVTKLKQAGILTGYPDGNFDGDRMMTRYEFAAIVYRAIMAGAASNPALSQDGTLDKLAKEFSPEMKHIRIDTIAKDKNGKPTIERVRVIPEAKQ